MLTPKDNPALLEEWKKLKDSLSYRAIARLYGVAVQTVEYWLVPGFKEKKMAHKRWYRQKQKEKKVNMKNYQKKYRLKPDIYLKRKTYDLKYKQVVRHIDNLFPQIFNSNPELPLFEISGRIDNLTGVHLKESTLETLLNKYNGKARDPPLIKTESGQYQLNPSFYK